MSHSEHLVRCLTKISDLYFIPTQTLVVIWSQSHLLYPNLNTSGMTRADGFGVQDRVEKVSLNEPRNIVGVEDLLFTEISQWLLVVYGNSRERVEKNETDTHGSYIILTATDTDEPERVVTGLHYQLNHLAGSNSWNPRARFVVALLNTFNCPAHIAQRLFEELWKHKIINAVVLVTSSEEAGEDGLVPALGAYTWYPYQSAERCIRVEDVTLLDTWVEIGSGYFARNTHLFPQKINTNLHGCPMRIITQQTIFAVEDPHREYVNHSALPRLVYRNGWEVRLLKVITQAMNMTEDYLLPLSDFLDERDDKGDFAGFTRELVNGNADVSVGLLVVRGTLPVEVTIPHHWGQLSWYVPCGSKYPRWMSISRMFSASVWVSVLMSVALSVPIITFLGRVSDDSIYKTQSNTFSNTWAAILSVSVSAMPQKWPLRCFFISWICYSLAVDTVFQTYLTSFLIDPGIMPHVRNVEELAHSDMKVGFSDLDSVFYENKTDAQSLEIMEKRVKCGTCFLWAMKYKNISILTSNLVYSFQISTIRPGDPNINLLCQIEDGVVEHGQIVMVLPKGICLFDRINTIVFRVIEAGIFSEWVKMTNHIQMIERKSFSPQGLLDEYYELSLEHLQSAFYLLLFGYCISFVIFITELMCRNIFSF
jgi:hypothetical protein